MNRKVIVSLVAMVAIAGATVALTVALMGTSADEFDETVEREATKPIDSAASAKKAGAAAAKKTRKSKTPVTEAKGGKAEKHDVSSDVDKLAPELRALAEELDKALDEEDFKKVSELAAQAARSGNPILLRKAVESCKWFGPKSLSDLAMLTGSCLKLATEARNALKADPTSVSAVEASEDAEDVLQDSYMAIEEKLGEIEDEAEKASLVGKFMKTAYDEDVLTMLEGQLNSIVDEKLLVETAVDVIANGSGAAAEHAKESYKFQTGEDYTTPEAAKAWIAENYTPPEE